MIKKIHYCFFHFWVEKSTEKAEQDHTKEILGNEYKDYNLVLATTFGMPIGASHVRTKMKQIIKKEGLPDVVFHSLRHTSVTYKLKLSGGDIKAVQGDSGHAQSIKG